MAQQTIETEGWTFFDWIQANTRTVTIAAALLAIGAAGYLFYVRSADIKRLNAERGLNQAKQALSAGNAALAQTDLDRVATRYKGTPAGAQAALVLAQLKYDQGKIDEGLRALEAYQTAGAAGPSLPAVWSLSGDGQLAGGNAPLAASAYQKAADGTRMPGERAMYLAKAARALMVSGKGAEARVIWERLATDPDAVMLRNEAEIRLGELSVQPAGKS